MGINNNNIDVIEWALKELKETVITLAEFKETIFVLEEEE